MEGAEDRSTLVAREKASSQLPSPADVTARAAPIDAMDDGAAGLSARPHGAHGPASGAVIAAAPTSNRRGEAAAQATRQPSSSAGGFGASFADWLLLGRRLYLPLDTPAPHISDESRKVLYGVDHASHVDLMEQPRDRPVAPSAASGPFDVSKTMTSTGSQNSKAVVGPAVQLLSEGKGAGPWECEQLRGAHAETSWIFEGLSVKSRQLSDHLDPRFRGLARAGSATLAGYHPSHTMLVSKCRKQLVDADSGVGSATAMGDRRSADAGNAGRTTESHDEVANGGAPGSTSTTTFRSRMRWRLDAVSIARLPHGPDGSSMIAAAKRGLGPDDASTAPPRGCSSSSSRFVIPPRKSWDDATSTDDRVGREPERDTTTGFPTEGLLQRAPTIVRASSPCDVDDGAGGPGDQPDRQERLRATDGDLVVDDLTRSDRVTGDFPFVVFTCSYPVRGTIVAEKLVGGRFVKDGAESSLPGGTESRKNGPPPPGGVAADRAGRGSSTRGLGSTGRHQLDESETASTPGGARAADWHVTNTAATTVRGQVSNASQQMRAGCQRDVDGAALRGMNDKVLGEAPTSTTPQGGGGGGARSPGAAAQVVTHAGLVGKSSGDAVCTSAARYSDSALASPALDVPAGPASHAALRPEPHDSPGETTSPGVSSALPTLNSGPPYSQPLPSVGSWPVAAVDPPAAIVPGGRFLEGEKIGHSASARGATVPESHDVSVGVASSKAGVPTAGTVPRRVGTTARPAFSRPGGSTFESLDAFCAEHNIDWNTRNTFFHFAIRSGVEGSRPSDSEFVAASDIQEEAFCRGSAVVSSDPSGVAAGGIRNVGNPGGPTSGCDDRGEGEGSAAGGLCAVNRSRSAPPACGRGASSRTWEG